jgi:hypothetical protein
MRKVKAEGTVFQGEFLKFYYVCQSSQPSPVQIAVVVNKGYGTAVRRNLIKRRIREACRTLIGSQVERTNSFLSPLSALVVYRGSKRRPSERVSFANIMNDVVALRAVIQSSFVSK